MSHALDPEALRDLLARYFGELSAIVRRHGGIVEKYIGDAIMAVFGVPILHEDDALRAVRAAVEMRDSLGALNRELEAGWGVRLASRIGVNTGEVIAGDHTLGHMFVTGEAVNVAKRLEAGGDAERDPDRASDARAGPRRGRGRAQRTADAQARQDDPTPSTVIRIRAHAPGLARRFDTPFVGRERQLALLATVFAQVASERACHLLTVLGDAGVGKSRLVREFTSRLADGGVTVLRGRCLPYGEGITYWPLAEIVREIARADGPDPGEQSAATLGALLAGDAKAELIAERVAKALGLAPAPEAARARRPSGPSAGCSRRWRARARWSSCWTTCTGPSRPSST